jgi:hypothetical protein
MNVPEPPIVANGVVFARCRGEFTRQVKENGQLYSAKQRIENCGKAVVCAFDAANGKNCSRAAAR